MKDRIRCRFLNALRTIYFCKDRKYENDSERVFAESALRKLWEYDEITVAGIRYTRREIRKAMFDEMMPEELDDAIRRWKEHGETSAEQLYRQLFLTVVLANALELYHKVMRCESIPIECEVRVKVVA